MSLEIQAISTTVSCSVASGTGHLSAETDSRFWGYNGGNNQFFEGGICYVLVYKSINVEIDSWFCSNTSIFNPTTKVVGYNIKMEGISFSNPINNTSLPIGTATVPRLLQKKYNNAGGISYIPGYTNLRLNTWNPNVNSIKPIDAPYGFIYIEYSPLCAVWAFSNLQKNPSLISTQVHGVLFGVAVAQDYTFLPLS